MIVPREGLTPRVRGQVALLPCSCLARALLPPSPPWQEPLLGPLRPPGLSPRANTHSQAEAERTSGAPSVQLNTPLLLPQGAQALAEPMGSAL